MNLKIHHHGTNCPTNQGLVLFQTLRDHLMHVWSFPSVFDTLFKVFGKLLFQMRNHQRSTAESAEKSHRVGPSVLTLSKSLRVELLRRALPSVFMIFKVEKKCSTLAVEKGKLKATHWPTRSLATLQYQAMNITGTRFSCNYLIQSYGKF